MEVGSGFGTFAAVAQESKQFQQVIGIEPTPEMAQACRDRGVTVIEKKIEAITEEIKEVDIAVSFECIEHLFAPKTFVSQCARLLKQDGLLVLSCPNGKGFDVATLREESLAVDAEHVNLFNPHSLGLLVEACGFEVLNISTPGRLDAEFVQMAIQEGRYDVSQQPFLKRVLVDEWEQLGWPFQQFLAENGLSAHMWMAARKK